MPSRSTIYLPPNAPVRVSQTSLSNGGAFTGDSISVQGRYAYIAEGAGTTNGFEVFDISTPTAPTRVSQSALANSGNADGIFVEGRYAYVAEGSGTTKALETFDLGGAYIQNEEVGSLEAGSLSLRNNLAAVDAAFSGGVNVGQSLNVTGSASVVSATFHFQYGREHLQHRDRKFNGLDLQRPWQRQHRRWYFDSERQLRP